MRDFLLHRRQVIWGLLGALFADRQVFAQAGNDGKTALPIQAKPSRSSRIDVHAHYIPELYRRAAEAAGQGKPDGNPTPMPQWSPELALETMDRLNIGSAILSISSPGVHFGGDGAARSLARAVNEEGAALMQRYPRRFGLFASLPLPDVDGALKEIDYAFDVLKADGIALLTNFRGIYLGDARFDPVFAELDRRAALVFMHPTSPYCPGCQNGLNYPAPMIEFMFETTRAVTHLILSRSLSRYANVRLIVPHAGGALPTLSDRIANLAPNIGLKNPPSSEEILTELRRLHYDLAGHAVPKMLDSLLSVTDVSHLLYGSDWPFTPEAGVRVLAQKFEQSPRFTEKLRAQIVRENALALLPRLQSAVEK